MTEDEYKATIAKLEKLNEYAFTRLLELERLVKAYESMHAVERIKKI